MGMDCMYEARETAYKGRTLVASCHIEAGQVVLRDKPVLLIPPAGERSPAARAAEKYGLQPVYWAAWECWQHLNPEMRTTVRDCYVGDFAGPAAVQIRAAAEGLYAAGYLPDEKSVEDIVNLSMAVKFSGANSKWARVACGNGKDEVLEQVEVGIVLCPIFALMSHSCDPTTSVYTSDESGERTVRALKPLQPGMEFTFNYYADELLYMPVQERQHSTRRNNEFTCACHRCEEEASWPKKLLQPDLALVSESLHDLQVLLDDPKLPRSMVAQSAAACYDELSLATVSISSCRLRLLHWELNGDTQALLEVINILPQHYSPSVRMRAFLQEKLGDALCTRHDWAAGFVQLHAAMTTLLLFYGSGHPYVSHLNTKLRGYESESLPLN